LAEHVVEVEVKVRRAETARAQQLQDAKTLEQQLNADL
jgi:hypothetical protein